jgi:hypothetical protein
VLAAASLQRGVESGDDVNIEMSSTGDDTELSMSIYLQIEYTESNIDNILTWVNSSNNRIIDSRPNHRGVRYTCSRVIADRHRSCDDRYLPIGGDDIDTAIIVDV